MKRLTLIALAFVLSSTVAANAATVQFSLILDLDGTYELRASASAGDNFGIASYSAQLNNVLSIDHTSPRDGFASGPSGVGPAGFTSLRTPDNNPIGIVFASQDTITPTPNLIRGFGQVANSFAALSIADFTGGTQLESPSWDADLLLATGTYELGGPQPGFVPGSVELFSNVFSSQTGSQVVVADVQAVVIPAVPEPASLALMGTCLVGLVLRRRNG